MKKLALFAATAASIATPALAHPGDALHNAAAHPDSSYALLGLAVVGILGAGIAALLRR